MKMQDVGLYGCAWQTESGLQCPVIYGHVERDASAVTGVLVGVSAASVSRQGNSHEVTDGDAVLVSRLPGEDVYRGLDDSLVQRAARLHGTSTPWRLVY